VRPARLASWVVAGAVVVLGARSLAYALSPAPLARLLEHRAGGPALPLVTLVSLTFAVALAAAIVWLTAIGVGERRALETRPVAFDARLRLGRLVARAVGLWLVTMPAFALTESYIHWRQGLGWHGLHCLTGPVHRDAIPILGALSLVAAALATAVEHLLAWMRRTLAALAPRPRPALVLLPLVPGLEIVAAPSLAAAPVARGPPPRS
jgi:hypothetical protein